MRTYRFFLLVFGIGIALAAHVFAVGSGSGGSVPACTTDTWTCTDWSVCPRSGVATRVCTLTADCPSVETPQPALSEPCTPPAVPPPAPSRVCTEDKWECGPWPSSCDISGAERRSCRLVSDCPNSSTPPPQVARPCSRLQCGGKAALADRIACRLNLTPEGIAQEFKIQYLPEECRALSDKTELKECVARYQSYQPCWALPAGEPRFACARNVLKLGPVISEEVKKCQGEKGAAQVACKDKVKENALYLIKFRFYDLEQRAEELANRGADLNAVAALDAIIETKKQQFDAAKSKDEMRQVILDVRSAWQDFVKKVQSQVK